MIAKVEGRIEVRKLRLPDITSWLEAHGG